MQTTRTIAVFVIVGLGSSCATTQSVKPGASRWVAISDLGIAFRSDRRTDTGDRRLGERAASDIILLKATIQNPFLAPQSIVLACRRVDSTMPAIERQLVLQPSSRETVTLAGFMADPLAYRLRCRLQGTGQGAPVNTEWVEAEVPANDTLLSAPM